VTGTVRLIRPTDPGWEALLAHARHDVHHLPGWSTASAPLEPGEPLAVIASDGAGSMLVPLVSRPLDGGRWDAVSPYGYAGPVFTSERSPHVALLDVAAEHLRAEGCVSWFVRLHPLLDTWASGHADAQEHGWTVSIDLTQRDDVFLSGLRKDHRSDLRRGEADGIRVRAGVGDTDLATFVALHSATMQMRGAADYHRFGAPYFAALREGLGAAFLLLLAERAGRAVAGAIFTLGASSGIVGYHLAAAEPRPPRGATKLLIAEGRRWGRELGFTRMLLGGGLGSDEDALFAFKAGFSPERHRFRTLRVTLDQEEYARRCASVGATSTATSEYFPAYRRPRDR